MNTDKQFKCSFQFTPVSSIAEAAGWGFGTQVEDGLVDVAEVEARFDALEIGETLVDEDGDTWERIA